MKGKQRVLTLLFALLLCLTLVLPASGAQAMPRVVDDAGLLTGEEEAQLGTLLEEISERQQADVLVVTASTLSGKSPMEYADDYFDDNGYGPDGVLLLISMEDRDCWISTSGRGIDALGDWEIEEILDEIWPDLAEGNYAQACQRYAGLCDDYFTRNGEGESFPVFFCLIFALAVGFIVALIATGVMKGKLKSVRGQRAANSYVRANSLNITESRELFLYHRVSRHPKPKNNGGSGGARTHISSSGHVHGGGGRKF